MIFIYDKFVMSPQRKWRCALIFLKLTENLPEHLETPSLVQIFGRTRYAATPKFELLAAGTEVIRADARAETDYSIRQRSA